MTQKITLTITEYSNWIEAQFTKLLHHPLNSHGYDRRCNHCGEEFKITTNYPLTPLIKHIEKEFNIKEEGKRKQVNNEKM